MPAYTNETIRWIFDSLGQEPMYIYEMVRKYAKSKGKKPSEVRKEIFEALGKLIEEGRVDYWQYWTEVGSEAWEDYKLCFLPHHPDWNDYEKKLQHKMKRIIKISKIGKINAEKYEKAVYQAVKRLFPDAERTAFNSDKPDVIVKSKKLLFEASARYENPINYNYVVRKLRRWRAYYGNDWLVIFISPNITSEALRLIRKTQHLTDAGLDREVLLRAKWIQYPKIKDKAHEGFPIFATYKYYADWIKEVGRKVRIIHYYEMVNALEKALRVSLRRYLE